MLNRRLFWFFSAILFVIFLLIFSYKENTVKLNPSFQTSTMKNLYLTHKEDNKIKWELSAHNAIFPKGNKEVILNSIKLSINNTPHIYLTSESGIYEIKKGDVILRKTVELHVKKAKFTTDSLIWNSKDEIITTENAVKFSGRNFLIKGTGLFSKINQQKVRIPKNVKAIFYH